LFADDLKLYTGYKIDALHNDLHTAVNRLTEWAKLWQLQIAIPKCSLFRICNPQWHVFESVQRVTYNIDGFVLPLVDQIRDLGVHHDCRLKYDKHISLIVHNAYKRALLIDHNTPTLQRDRTDNGPIAWGEPFYVSLQKCVS